METYPCLLPYKKSILMMLTLLQLTYRDFNKKSHHQLISHMCMLRKVGTNPTKNKEGFQFLRQSNYIHIHKEP